MSKILCFGKKVFITLIVGILICTDVICAKKKSRKQKYVQDEASSTTESANQGQYPYYGYTNDNSHVGFSYINHYNGNTDKGQEAAGVIDMTNNEFQGTHSSMPYDSKYEPNTNAAVTEIIFDSRRGHKQYEEDPYSSLHRPTKALTPLYSYDAVNPSLESNYHNTENAYSSNYLNPTAPREENKDYGKPFSEVKIFTTETTLHDSSKPYGNKLKYKKKNKYAAPLPQDSNKLHESEYENNLKRNPDPTINAERHKQFLPQHVTGFNVKSKFKDDISLPEYTPLQYPETQVDNSFSKWYDKPFTDIPNENSFLKLNEGPFLKIQAEESFTKWNEKPYSEMKTENGFTKWNERPFSEIQAESSYTKWNKRPIAEMQPEDSLTKWNNKPFPEIQAEEMLKSSTKPYSELPKYNKKTPYSDFHSENNHPKLSKRPSSDNMAEQSFSKWTTYAPLSLEHITFDKPKIEHIRYEEPNIEPMKLGESNLLHSKIPETYSPIPMAMSHYNFVTESPDMNNYASALSNYDDPIEDSMQAGSGYKNRHRTPLHSPSASHYPMQKPMTVEIPQTIIIPVPQPYPIRVPVPRPVAVPVVRELRVPVEKQVPYPVYKNVPYPVEKPIPVPIEKQVAVPVARPYPVPIPHVRPVFHHSRRLRDQSDSISDYRDEDEEWEDTEGTGVASLRKRVNSRLRHRGHKLRRARRSRRGNLKRTRRRGPTRFKPMYSLKSPPRVSDWRREKESNRFDHMEAGSLKIFDWRQEHDSNRHDHFLDHHLDPEHFIENHDRYHRELERGRNYLSNYNCHRERI